MKKFITHKRGKIFPHEINSVPGLSYGIRELLAMFASGTLQPRDVSNGSEEFYDEEDADELVSEQITDLADYGDLQAIHAQRERHQSAQGDEATSRLTDRTREQGDEARRSDDEGGATPKPVDAEGDVRPSAQAH